MNDVFGEAIGIWHIDVGGANLDIRPILGDNRNLRKILMNNQKDTSKMVTMFEDFMVNLIKRDYPESDIDRIKEYVEFNSMQLLEETLIAFRWTTRDQLDKTKNEEVKKLIGNE